jgi:hypothetical protein
MPYPSSIPKPGHNFRNFFGFPDLHFHHPLSAMMELSGLDTNSFFQTTETTANTRQATFAFQRNIQLLLLAVPMVALSLKGSKPVNQALSHIALLKIFLQKSRILLNPTSWSQ